MHLITLLYMLFASIFTIQKNTLNYCEPFFMVGSRMLVAGIILLVYEQIKNKSLTKKLKLSHISGIAILSICQIYLTNILEIWAIKHMVSSKACLIYSLSPFVSALVAYIVLKERVSKKKIYGMLIGFFGLFPIIFAQTQNEVSTGMFLVFTFAELAIIGAVFCSVYGWIYLKKIMQDYSFSPVLANGLSMTVGGMLALVHSYFANEAWSPVPVTNVWPFVRDTVALCIISNVICYNLYGYLLKRYSATFMSFAGLVTPFFAALFGYFWLDEQISWHYYVSIALFTLGLIIFYKQEGSRDKTLVVAANTI